MPTMLVVHVRLSVYKIRREVCAHFNRIWVTIEYTNTLTHTLAGWLSGVHAVHASRATCERIHGDTHGYGYAWPNLLHTHTVRCRRVLGEHLLVSSWQSISPFSSGVLWNYRQKTNSVQYCDSNKRSELGLITAHTDASTHTHVRHVSTITSDDAQCASAAAAPARSDADDDMCVVLGPLAHFCPPIYMV